MKTQRGYVLPFAIPAWVIYLAIIAAIACALWYAYTTIDSRGYDRGKSETEADYTKRDNQALQAALARVDQLQKEKAAAELAHENRVAAIAADHKREMENANNQRNLDVAAVRAGYRLRDRYAGSAALSDRDEGAETAAAAGQCDGGAGAELSEQATGFLFTLVNDADDIVRQLRAAQKVIIENIRTCNGP